MKLSYSCYDICKKFNCQTKIYLRLLFLLFLQLAGCHTTSQNENKLLLENRSYFSFDSKEDVYLFISVLLSDTTVANMIFDSGSSIGSFDIDSAFHEEHTDFLGNISPASTHTQYQCAWTNRKKKFFKYKNSRNVRIGYTSLRYDHITITDYRNSFNNSRIDGLFSIPKNDTNHIWELNFENNYLEVHKRNGFKAPKVCYWLPFYNNYNPYFLYVLFNLKIKTQDGDTLKIKRPFLVDTGIQQDIVLLNEVPEVKFFDKKDAVWTSIIGTYNKRYTVEGTLFDTLFLKDLRIYTYDKAFQMDGNMALIGLNFLKRFNVFFDMKNNRLGLQPIKNFKRLTLPFLKRFHLSIKDVNGKYLITKIADYKTNDYKIAGLQEGDEVTAINDIPYTPRLENDSSLLKKNTLVFDILRQNKPMKITVIPDPNEPQGD